MAAQFRVTLSSKEAAPFPGLASHILPEGSCSVFNQASAFPFVARIGAYNGPERLQPQSQGVLPAGERRVLPLVKGSEEPRQF
ncbi:rCG39303 [Rattus norvegicus]|uniref:RCG39303 n=1 Tax=Rattus norvegicus TaxID=10116 RepID=A6I669_RAT|nr:rCG39303 [Rattus norvegicus]